MDAQSLMLLPEEVEQERKFLLALGLRLPNSSFLLQQPFGSPLVRRSYIVPSRWHWQPLPEFVSPEDLAKDLAVLRVAMEKTYIGWDTAASTGWDWEEFFDRWHRKLMSDSQSEIPVHTAFTPWYDLLRYQIDNHSGPRVAAPRRDFAQTIYLMDAPPGPVKLWRNDEGAVGGIDSSDPAQRPWLAALATDGGRSLKSVWAMSHPAHHGTWEAVNSDGRWLPVTNVCGFEKQRANSVAELLGRTQDELGYRKLSQNVGYLRLPTLSYNLALQAMEHAKWLPSDAFDVKCLVVDVRGNLGGAADVIFTVLERLKSWTQQGGKVSFAVRWKECCLTDALQWGHAQFLLANFSGVLPPRLRRTVQSVLYRVLLPSDLGCAVLFREHASNSNYGQHQFPSEPRSGEPRIIILTDGDCGSDGEFLVFALALIPGAVVVGTCTAGVGQYARPGYMVLPFSRVGFRLATALTDISGGHGSFDGYGLRMDVILPQDAPLTTESLLRLTALLGD